MNVNAEPFQVGPGRASDGRSLMEGKASRGSRRPRHRKTFESAPRSVNIGSDIASVNASEPSTSSAVAQSNSRAQSRIAQQHNQHQSKLAPSDVGPKAQSQLHRPKSYSSFNVRRRAPVNDVYGSQSSAQHSAESSSSHTETVPRAPNSWRSHPSHNTSNGSATHSHHARHTEHSEDQKRSGADLDLRQKLTLALQDETQDCPICLDAIFRKDPIWSCKTCHIPIHLFCLRNWIASCMAPKGAGPQTHQNVRDVPRPTRPNDLSRMMDLTILDSPTNGAQISVGLEWRCPACQHAYPVPEKPSKTMGLDYFCFCARLKQPPSQAYSRSSIPHSCQQSCSRRGAHTADESCAHACPLTCHPGPCPPCNVPIKIQCPCGQTQKTVPCSQSKSADRVTCSKVCNKPLACGRHKCTKFCHMGQCEDCQEVLEVTCLCEKETRSISCVEYTPPLKCDQVTQRFYACGKHSYSVECSIAPETARQCPFDPALQRTCPCGATEQANRTACTDEIKCCANICNKAMPCGHSCSSKCHLGDCPPCQELVSEMCRCGTSNRQIECAVRTSQADADVFTCEKRCSAMRKCGRHECGTICCPLAFLAQHQDKQRRKPKTQQSRQDVGLDLDVVDPDGLHDCPLPCPKLLSCGQHQCPLKDHKGPCPPCGNTSWEEAVCPCGRTVFEPPIRCGAVLECTYPCHRQRECGHDQTTHLCHQDSEPCPPCPYLTTKHCMCGKKEMRNQRCSQGLVTCGEPCKNMLSCGFHQCQKICHAPGECEEPCVQRCNKLKKLCGHPCAAVCHAPSSCDEVQPCTTVVRTTCPCGRLQQSIPCGVCEDHPEQRPAFGLKCVDQCLINQRNEAIADALGINALRAEKQISWSKDLVQYYANNTRSARMFEEQINNFMTIPAKILHMSILPTPQRQFVMALAAIYGLNAVEIDQEPSPALDLHKDAQSKIPSPLLSVYASTGRLTATPLNQGSLSFASSVVTRLPSQSAWDM